MDANLRTLDRLQTELTSSTESLSKLGERLISLEKAIKEYSDFGATTTVPFEKDRRIADQKAIDPRAARLQELKQKLNEYSAVYKDNYPDVVYLKEEIHRLEKMPVVAFEPRGQEGMSGGNPRESAGNVPKLIDPYLRELMKERNEVKSELAFLKDKQAQTQRQIKEFEGRVERTPAREQSLAMLIRDYDNLQKSYQALLDKRTNARIWENYENRQFGEQYRIIEAASLPEGPEPPTKLHFLLGGLLLGCLGGVGSAVGAELLKGGFRRPEEAEQYLGLPVIASIPGFSSATGGAGILHARALLAGPEVPAAVPVPASPYPGYEIKGRNGHIGKLGKPGSRSGGGDAKTGLPPKMHLIAKWGPASLIAEQYRVAATRLLLMAVEKKHAITLVTSSVMGEGKTTTAVNLAYVLAHDLNKSTLLIDCDFKRPMVHQYAGVSMSPGLANVIQGDDLIENCLHQLEDLPLWVLPVGIAGKRPIGLSGIQYLKKVLPEIRNRYDHIILDAPPILPLADVNVLGSLADTLAFVVRAGGTSKDIVKKALRSVGETGEAGIILTQVEMEYAPYFMYATPYASQEQL
jgi:capsular exopolysaccharide synthesis family protein